MVTRIAVLMTCYNRKDTTLGSLGALFAQRLPPDCSLSVYLTDDNSSDGTGAAVRERFPQVHVCQGSGSLYWNGALRLSWETALKEEGVNFYLWLNDDTILVEDALLNLLTTYRNLKAQHGELIVVGSTQDPITGVYNYGGLTRHSWLRRLRFDLTPLHDTPIRTEAMNGNCVLVPAFIVERIGINNRAFSYSMGMGDIDYSLRATAAGFGVWVMPGFVGTCGSNSSVGTFEDVSLGIGQRWQKVRTPKGLMPSKWLVFARLHAGWLWPIWWASPYLHFFARGIGGWFRKGDRYKVSVQ